MRSFQKTIQEMKFKTHWITLIKWFVGSLIFIFIFLDGYRFLAEIHFDKTIFLLKQIPKSLLFLYAILGVLAVSLISLYDMAWFHFNPREIRKNKIFRTAFIANSINNVAGGGIGGTIIRALFYKKFKISDNDILKINVLLVPSFFTGLGVLMWVVFFSFKYFGNNISNYPATLLLILLFCLYLIIYLSSEFISYPTLREKLEKVGFIGSIKLKLSVTTVSLCQWLATVFFVWFIGIHIDETLSFLQVLFFFSVASGVGIISPMPSGIGVFDIIMTIGLRESGLTATESVVVVMLYRTFYHILPFILAVFLATYDFEIKGSGLKKTKEIPSIFIMLEKTIDLTKNQLNTLKDIPAILLWVLMLIAGAIMIISAVIPSLPQRVYLIEHFFSLSTLRFSQQTSLLLGLLLLIFSEEVRLRLKKAYYISMLLLIFGSIFTLLKGFNIEETIFLILITIVFSYTKTHFYRVFLPFSWIRMFQKMIVAQGIISMYILSGQSFYTLHKGVELLYLTPFDYINNGIVLSFIVQTFIILWYLFGYFSPHSLPPWFSQTRSFVYKTLDEFLNKYEGTVLTHLIYCGDKYIYLSDNKNALIAFRPFGDKLIVLGDPIGEFSSLVDILDEFRHYADTYNYFPVYYQVKEENLPDYHEIGYTFFKLGEEGVVDLNNFNLDGHKYKEFRNSKNRLEREGWEFKILNPPHSETLINELESISTEWLNGKREKSFSVGRFDYDYLNKSPIAIVSSSAGKTAAFASILPIYNGKMFSVDLIRFSSKSPNGTMDYLLLKILLWGKDQGYLYFHIGMAPLSNVGESKYALKEEQVARLIFGNAKNHYNFKGLRKYKDKFYPQWTPKYLAYPTQMRVGLVILSVSVLISLSRKKLLKPQYKTWFWRENKFSP